MQVLKANGIAAHIRDEGPREGRAVLLVNSLGTDLRVWDRLLPFLPADSRIVRYDKRGHGLTDVTHAPYDMSLLVSDAEEVCKSLRLTEITIIGLSIGGLIAQGLAARRPDLVKAVVLMDTAAKIGSAETWQQRIDLVRSGGIAAIGDTIMERWFTTSFRKTDPSVALWRNMLTRTSVEGYVGCCAAIAKADFTESTRSLRIPVLALAGDQDGSTPPDLVRATAQLCDAEFQIITGAGHLPCVEQPEVTGRLISGFLERTAR